MNTEKAPMTGTRGRARWLAAGLLFSSLTAAAPTLAQEKGAPARESIKLYEEGVKAAKAGQWEKARTVLRAAFERMPDVKRAANLGLVELMAGKPRDAAEHLSFFLREAPDITDQDRQVTEVLLAKARTRIGTVTIQVDTSGAEVLVDGRRVGTSPLAGPVFVEPGSREIEAKKEGYTALRAEVEVAASSEPVVALTLSPLPKTALVPVPRPGQGTSAPPETAPPRWRTWGIVSGVGLAAVGVGAGIGFSFAEQAKNTAAMKESGLLALQTPEGQPICPSQSSAPQCGRLHELVEARDTYRNVAIAGFVVGGVGVAGALFSALWRPGRPGRSTGNESAFSIVPSGQGVVVTGSF